MVRNKSIVLSYRGITKKECNALLKLKEQWSGLVSSYDKNTDILIFKPVSTEQANDITKDLKKFLKEN